MFRLFGFAGMQLAAIQLAMVEAGATEPVQISNYKVRLLVNDPEGPGSIRIETFTALIQDNPDVHLPFLLEFAREASALMLARGVGDEVSYLLIDPEQSDTLGEAYAAAAAADKTIADLIRNAEVKYPNFHRVAH